MWRKNYATKSANTLKRTAGYVAKVAASKAVGSVINSAYRAATRPKYVKPPPVKRRSLPIIRKGANSTALVVPSKKGTGSNLKKRVRRLEKEMKDDISKVLYIVDTKDTVRPSMGTALNGYRNLVEISTIELALAQARFFDPATPGTLITSSLASPTYTQSIGVSVSCKVHIRNNYQVPCVITCAVIQPKVATSTTPTSAWTNGLTDAGNPSNSSYLLTMKDSSEFNDTYRVKGKWITKIVEPGDMVIVTYGQKLFDYDPSYFDTNTSTFQPKGKSAMFFYRVHGVLGHDSSVATEQGIMPAGIDIHHISRYTIHYNSGGAAVKTIVLSQGASSSFTNGGVVSEQPISDNIAYSVS